MRAPTGRFLAELLGLTIGIRSFRINLIRLSMRAFRMNFKISQNPMINILILLLGKMRLKPYFRVLLEFDRKRLYMNPSHSLHRQQQARIAAEIVGMVPELVRRAESDLETMTLHSIGPIINAVINGDVSGASLSRHDDALFHGTYAAS